MSILNIPIYRYLKIPALAVIFTVALSLPAHANLSDDIAAKQQQIQALQQQIDAYQNQVNSAGQQSQTLKSEIARLNAQIGGLNAQINRLEASIDETGLEIQQTTASITDAQEKLDFDRQTLAAYIRETDQNDQQSLAQILLEHNALSEFFDAIHSIQLTQDNLHLAIQSITDLEASLDQHRDALQSKQNDLQQMKSIQESQKQDLASTKNNQNQLLKVTQGQESKYQQLVKQGKQDLQRLQQEISSLQRGGITVQDAIKYGQMAAISAGIRPAFLLGLLEIESRLGENVGTGNWKDDMYLCYQRLAKYYSTKSAYYLQRAETEKAAYLKIVNSLGLDPDSQKVSKEPNYGCGGAMGPAQFIPSTWAAYAARVSQLTGHTPVSPWNTGDAFTAAAIKLAAGGATSQTRAGELAAAKAYIGGSPNCAQAICASYANAVLQKAAEIAQNL